MESGRRLRSRLPVETAWWPSPERIPKQTSGMATIFHAKTTTPRMTRTHVRTESTVKCVPHRVAILSIRGPISRVGAMKQLML